jgi:glycosyltransferase involved in cell wall biosynthesis
MPETGPPSADAARAAASPSVQGWAALRAYGLRAVARRLRERLLAALRPRERLAPRARWSGLVLTEVGGASRRYRGEHLVEQLNLLGLTGLVLDYQRADLRGLEARAGFFVLHRVRHDTRLEAFLARARAAGRPVLYDADDLVFDPEDVEVSSEFRARPPWKAGAYHWDVARRHRALALCDAALVATPALAARVRRLFPEKPARVHRNALSREMLAAAGTTGTAAERAGAPVLTYLSGTATHAADFRECAAGLARLLGDRPAARLALVGELDLPPELAGRAAQIVRHPFQDWRALPDFHRRSWINLAPLERENPFTACKSALKFFEAGLCAVPTAASAGTAFDEAIRPGANGCLCTDAADWHAQLAALLADEPRRRELGRRAREDVLREYAPEVRARELEALLREFLGPDGLARERAAAAAPLTE